ncbi:MAG: TRAP transporter large permease subunit [candidate division KSB1 bacterium]|nr:TRAP transporter large permease subunit [candidate division KSB1 bacterium]
MHDMMPLLLFVALFILLMLGFPVAFTLGGVSLIFGLLTFGLDFFNLLPLRIWGVMTNYVLIAVPLFIYMGVMLEKSGLAEELLETMALLFGKLRGGLAISVVVVGALLAASTGIVGATVVTMGLLSLPTMLKRGYSPELATGTIAASGTLGQIIPPSIVLVLLGSVLNVSIGDMFLGAVIPGFLLVFLYLVWIGFVALTQPQSAPTMPEKELAKFRGRAMYRQIFRAFLPPILLMVAVLGSIFAGIASPTEAAAVGALGAGILTMIRGRFNLPTLKAVMTETTYLTCMVFIILVGATAFGLVFRGMGGDRVMTRLILEAEMGPHVFLAIVMIAIFIAGFFIDFIEITFIIVPVVEPIFKHMGVDLLWLGILIALNLQTSFLTPPFGFSLFYLKGVAPKNVATTHIYRGIIPFIVIQLLVLGMLIAFPDMATWLPAKILGD